MKNYGFIIFFSLVMIFYALINFYIIRRGLSVIGTQQPLRAIWIWSVIVLSSLFVIARFTERVCINQFSTVLVWLGAFWLAIMVYLVLQLALIDILRGLNHLIKFFPDIITLNPEKTKKITAVIVLTITFLTVLIGHINTWFPKVTDLNISINKKGGSIKELNIVAFSDVHLGSIIEKRHLKGIVNQVNALNPDIILIPGDIIDEDIAPVIKNNVGEVLNKLKAKYGVYAVTGNHEYIGGVAKAKEYLTNHNIQMLNDTAILIENSFYLIGREDVMISQFTGKKRKELSDIIVDVDTTKPMILLDHEPFKLEQAENAGIDLQLSGHTHDGQIWPFNFITDLIFEKGSGYIKKGNTHFYISSGIGGWGPPIRTNSRPEIIKIKLIMGDLMDN